MNLSFARNMITILLLSALTTLQTATAQEKKEMKTDGQMTLGVLLYPGFEVLDVFGPVEMFLNVPNDQLRVVMVAEKAGEAVQAGTVADQGTYTGPKVLADYGYDDAPHLDLILVPGGIGTFPALSNQKLLDFLKDRAAKAQITTTVCSGSGIAARAGLLDGRKATSNKEFYTIITSQAPKVNWVPNARWVDDGNMVTSSGVSAGIDMALAVIERLYGEEMAVGIAKSTEYAWHRDADVDPFAKDIK